MRLAELTTVKKVLLASLVPAVAAGIVTIAASSADTSTGVTDTEYVDCVLPRHDRTDLPPPPAPPPARTDTPRPA